MTWNLQNLFAVGAEDGPPSVAAYERKLDSLRALIDAVAPDVLAVQEIGSTFALTDLQARLAVPLSHAVTASPDGRGIRVGLLAKEPIADAGEVAAFPTGLAPIQTGDPDASGVVPSMAAMGRPALSARVVLPGRDVYVVVCHLKSKLLTFTRPDGSSSFVAQDEGQRARFAGYALNRRTSEAVTVRGHLDDVLDGHGDDRAVILAGDLNDEVDAATTQIVNGPPGSEIGTRGFAQPDAGDPWRMWNLAPLIPEAERFSRRYRGRDELIDHVFASKALIGTLPTVGTRAAEPGIRSIDDDPSSERGEPGSDHNAVVATFHL